ncbi:MAG: hypothetical protein Q9222_006985 [Ikaeria aurantiellina]
MPVRHIHRIQVFRRRRLRPVLRKTPFRRSRSSVRVRGSESPTHQRSEIKTPMIVQIPRPTILLYMLCLCPVTTPQQIPKRKSQQFDRMPNRHARLLPTHPLPHPNLTLLPDSLFRDLSPKKPGLACRNQQRMQRSMQSQRKSMVRERRRQEMGFRGVVDQVTLLALPISANTAANIVNLIASQKRRLKRVERQLVQMQGAEGEGLLAGDEVAPVGDVGAVPGFGGGGEGEVEVIFCEEAGVGGLELEEVGVLGVEDEQCDEDAASRFAIDPLAVCS